MFLSTNIVKICTVVPKKYPMMTKWVKGCALPATTPQSGAYAKQRHMVAITWEDNILRYQPLKESSNMQPPLTNWSNLTAFFGFLNCSDSAIILGCRPVSINIRMHCKSKNVPRVIPLSPHSEAGSASQKLTMREPAVRWKMAPDRGVMVVLKRDLDHIM